MSYEESTQFSIYKISYSEVKKHHTLTAQESQGDYAKKVCQFLLGQIKRKLQQNLETEKAIPTIYDVDADELKGIIYKTEHSPAWIEMARRVLKETQNTCVRADVPLVNVNVSYVLFYVNDDSIYAMTGGYGNHLIKNYIEKNWGLHLMPKLVRKDSVVIRQLKENNFIGNTSSMSKANRKTTNIMLEQDMNTIFRELSVELEKSICEELGIEYTIDESPGKKVGMVLKDALFIRRSFTLTELKKIIKKLEVLERKDNNFPLGYFVESKRLGIKTEELSSELVNIMVQKKIENVQLVGDDYLDYYTTASKYILLDENSNEYYTSSEPISLEYIFARFERDDIKLTKNFLKTFLKKWRIETKDSKGNNMLMPLPIINAIQGFVEYGENKIPCYIFQGQWYCMDGYYQKNLEQEYEDIYDACIKESEKIKSQFNLCKTVGSEDLYNNSFFDSKNVIVGHKALIDNIEIADMFYWDDIYVYLMCNKIEFDGSGSRDLTNQVWASADYFHHQMFYSSEKEQFLDKLYNKICTLYAEQKKNLPLNAEEFAKILSTKKICYVAGYIKGFKKNTKSLYSMYLMVDLYKKIYEKGFKCIVMGTDK